ncbi:ribokinase [Jiangella endophytica]|uniref:ribokinase n=1 Tax=Jiangella endophytica TaxID=1623398 RepID=UPI000E34B905|nr:ribokinase [Jiangella endophytica]
MIAVLGSANMDLVATVDRAPGRGETVTGRTFTTVPGGKGANQALAAARAGGDVAFLGAVGDDDFGRRVTALLAGAGIDVSGLAVSDQPTGTAHITVDATGDNSIVVVPGANATVTALTDAHRAALDAAQLVLLQLELPLPLVTEAALYARSRGVRVVLTPAPAVPLPPELLAAVDVLVPNEHEAALLAGVADPVEAARSLAAGGGDVVVTLGGRGALRLRAGDETAVPAFPVEAVDTTAAGDTFAGVLAVGLAEGLHWDDALRRASAAAALSVRRPGASSSMPDRAEIDAFLAEAS